MDATPKVSILIPARDWNDNLKKCLQEIEKLEYRNFEVLVDLEPGLPSEKRDRMLKKASGEIIACIDDDAYPRKDWLDNAIYLIRLGYLSVCGPGIIPPNSPFLEKVSDWILKFMPFNYRTTIKEWRYVKDYPTFNLIFKKEIIEKVGGFSCNYLTGEDTLICKKITDIGEKILYYPDIIVYHRRRPFGLPFLKQIATYAWTRGQFFKKYPSTSRKLVFIMPSLVLIGLVLTFFTYAVFFLKGLVNK